MKNIIIVLSGGLNKNEPNAWSKLRYDKAAELYLSTPNSLIISTTGRTYRMKKTDKTEGEIGKEYILSKYKINPEDILLDEDSKDTLSNAYNLALRYMNTDIRTLHVVTSKFHMKKARYVFSITCPKEQGWKIFFHETADNVDPKALKIRRRCEDLVIDFYKNHLIQDFKVIPGNLKSIENFILNYSKAYNPDTDEPFQKELTKKIQILTKISKNPLY